MKEERRVGMGGWQGGYSTVRVYQSVWWWVSVQYLVHSKYGMISPI